jgi:hypothetical protein
MPVSRLARRLAILAATAFGIQAGVLVLLHVLPTGYDPTVNFISEYAVGQYALWAGVSRFAHIVGLIAICSALHVSRVAPIGSWVNGALVLTLLATILGAAFPVDPIAGAFEGGGPPRFTTSGWIHALSGIVGAVTVLGEMGALTFRLHRVGRVASRYWILGPLSVVSPLAYIAMLMTRPATFPAGLLQRLFVAGTLMWLITFSVGIGSGGLGAQRARAEDA